MSHKILDRVKETTTTTGTGNITLSGAVTGFISFGSQMVVSDTCFYCIDNSAVGEWEVGLGTYSSTNTLTRTTVLSSSSANTAVNFSSGTKTVFITSPASQIQYLTSGTFTPVLEGTTTAGAGAYSQQEGYYYRSGDLCYIDIRVTITSHTGTGNIKITGLPFTSFALGTSQYQTLNILADSLTFTGQLSAVVVSNSTYILLQSCTTGSAPTGVAIDTACTLTINGLYRIA